MKNILLIAFLSSLSYCSEPISPAKLPSGQNLSVPSSAIDTQAPAKLSDDDIIERKEISFNNQKIKAVYFPELDKLPQHYYTEVIIQDNTYYALNFNEDHYVLINLENGTIAEQGENTFLKTDKNGWSYRIANAILKNSVVMNDFSHRNSAVMGSPTRKYLPYCKNAADCRYTSIYDVNAYALGTPEEDETPHGLVMQDTTYREESNRPLRLGMFAFSNSSYDPDYASAKSIVITSPSAICCTKGWKKKIVPADILGSVTKVWRLDRRGRFLVWFGPEHAFLFMIFDIERGLDIPENHLDNIHFVEYKTIRKHFGKYRDACLRAEKLSEWMRQYR